MGNLIVRLHTEVLSYLFSIQLIQLLWEAACQYSHVLLSTYLSFRSHWQQLRLIAMQLESFGSYFPRCFHAAHLQKDSTPMAAVLQSTRFWPYRWLKWNSLIRSELGLSISGKLGCYLTQKDEWCYFKWKEIILTTTSSYGFHSIMSICSNWRKKPSLKQKLKFKTPSKYLCASLHLHVPSRARQCLIARENPVLVCYFLPFGITAIGPRSAVNQCLIYHPRINVSCRLQLLSRVVFAF